MNYPKYMLSVNIGQFDGIVPTKKDAAILVKQIADQNGLDPSTAKLVEFRCIWPHEAAQFAVDSFTAGMEVAAKHLGTTPADVPQVLKNLIIDVLKAAFERTVLAGGSVEDNEGMYTTTQAMSADVDALTKNLRIDGKMKTPSGAPPPVDAIMEALHKMFGNIPGVKIENVKVTMGESKVPMTEEQIEAKLDEIFKNHQGGSNERKG